MISTKEPDNIKEILRKTTKEKGIGRSHGTALVGKICKPTLKGPRDCTFVISHNQELEEHPGYCFVYLHIYETAIDQCQDVYETQITRGRR